MSEYRRLPGKEEPKVEVVSRPENNWIRRKKLTLEIDAELHRDFKILCVTRGVPSMREAFEEAIINWMKEYKGYDDADYQD